MTEYQEVDKVQYSKDIAVGIMLYCNYHLILKCGI